MNNAAIKNGYTLINDLMESQDINVPFTLTIVNNLITKIKEQQAWIDRLREALESAALKMTSHELMNKYLSVANGLPNKEDK